MVDHKRCANAFHLEHKTEPTNYAMTIPQPTASLSPLAFVWTTHLTPIWWTNGHVEALPLTRPFFKSRNFTKMSHFIPLPHWRSKETFNRKPLNRSGGSRLFRPWKNSWAWTKIPFSKWIVKGVNLELQGTFCWRTHSVDQFAFEAHLTILWLRDVEQLYYYAILFNLLREAGLVLAGSKMGCSGPNEREEVMEKIRVIGYPGLGRKELLSRRSCHDYLFARIPAETRWRHYPSQKVVASSRICTNPVQWSIVH